MLARFNLLPTDFISESRSTYCQTYALTDGTKLTAWLGNNKSYLNSRQRRMCHC